MASNQLINGILIGCLASVPPLKGIPEEKYSEVKHNLFKIKLEKRKH